MDILEQSLQDPNHCLRYKAGWFFWDEADVDAFGPFETEQQCLDGMEEYARVELDGLPSNPDYNAPEAAQWFMTWCGLNGFGYGSKQSEAFFTEARS